MDDSNSYSRLSGNISFFINRRTSSEKTFYVFFYSWAIEEIDKLIENVKR